MTEIIQFPKRPRRPRPVAVGSTTEIPFSSADLYEIAQQLSSAAPEILDAVEVNGGSAAATLAFLDFLWELSRGAAPLPTEQAK